MNPNLLQKLGMTKKEVSLYLKLLEFGEVRVNTLAKSIGENRTSTYSLLHSMLNKGFVNFYEKKNVKIFSAMNPQILIDHFLDDAKNLKSFLPELLAITNKYAQKPKITFYEGVEGIKEIGEMLLEVPNSIREGFMGIADGNMHPDIRKYYEEDFLNRRIEKNIKYRGIIAGKDMPMTKDHPQDEKGHLRELKYIDPKIFPMKIHIDIFERNKVAIYSYNKDEMMGVVIEHESFYITMKTVFKLAWMGTS